MAGALKDLFDRLWRPTRNGHKFAGRPCGLFLTHGGGSRAYRSMLEIRRAFHFKPIGKVVLVRERPNRTARKVLRRLGARVAKAALNQ
jgi:NAD(P)H-dependent FMN reductase